MMDPIATGARAHLRNNVVGYISLFLVMAGGTAWASHGAPNSIDSADVVNNSLTTADLRNGVAVTSVDVKDDSRANGGLIGADIAADTLTGADIADTGSLGTLEINEGSLFNDNSLGGSDINESTLGKVPDAGAVDGIDSTQIATARGDNADTGECSGSLDILDETCADVDLSLAHPGRVVVDAVGSWQMLNGPARANCYVRADNDQLGDPNFSPLMTVADNGSLDVNDPISVQLVTTVLPAGLHSFEFKCNTESGASTSDIDGAYISAVLVGSG